MFLSASKVTVSPALTSWSLAPVFSPFAVAAEVAFQAAALMASATLPTVAILFSSPEATVGTAIVLILPVLTFNPLSPVVKVSPSVLTFTPALLTSTDLSAAFTLYLIVLVLLSAVSTDTLVPSPSIKSTVS